MTGHAGKQLDSNLPGRFRWRGLRPLAEDGTTAPMPDTDANREARHYPAGQAQGCGFPVVKLGICSPVMSSH